MDRTTAVEIARVFIADGNAATREYVRQLLADNYSTTSAVDGVEALRLLQTDPHDLVLAEVELPVLDGLGLLHALRYDTATQAVPVILLSARAGQEAKIEGLEAGADDYLIRPFADRELLARVATTLERGRVRREAAAVVQVSEERFRALSNASADVIYRMNPDWSEMRRLDGRGRLIDTPAPSRSWLEEYIDPTDQDLVRKTIQEAVRTKGMFELKHRVRLADGSLGWTLSRAVPLLGRSGEITEWIGSATDITAIRQNEELRSALAERDALLKEVHHRVKNNLQVIISLLEMQSHQSTDADTISLFEDACNRVGVIAVIHEMLYQSDTLSTVSLRSYAQRLVPFLVSFYEAQQQIQVSIEGADVQVELEKAVPCGLLLNELVSNSCKHAFPGGGSGSLTVRFTKLTGSFRLTVEDTGAGLPEEFHLSTSSTLGLRLVRTLAEQLRGSIQLHSGRGCRIDVEIPVSQLTSLNEAE